jgi:hypothetical protein|tara:strand:+ start:2839 stop:3591 length:753 start_codon:yes stop_codon:yes gene_type:complete
MITKKRFYKEKLLSATLTETLLVYLFILLAIASIYEKTITEFEEAFKKDDKLKPGQIAIDSTEFIQLQTKAFNYVDVNDELDDVNDELEKVKENIREKDNQIQKYKDLVGSGGVMPPPCILADNNQTLLEVDYGPNRTYLIKIRNLERTLRLNTKWILKNNTKHILTEKDFNELGFLLHESMRIDPNDSDCDINVPGAYSSANCYHCVYVVKIVDHSKDPQFSKSFSSFKLEKEVVKKMQRNLQNYFIIR